MQPSVVYPTTQLFNCLTSPVTSAISHQAPSGWAPATQHYCTVSWHTLAGCRIFVCVCVGGGVCWEIAVLHIAYTDGGSSCKLTLYAQLAAVLCKGMLKWDIGQKHAYMSGVMADPLFSHVQVRQLHPFIHVPKHAHDCCCFLLVYAVQYLAAMVYTSQLGVATCAHMCRRGGLCLLCSCFST